MMYVYAIGSIFTFLCMIIGVLFGQLTSDQSPPEQEQLLDEALSEEEQEQIEKIIEEVKNAKTE